ncbi:glycosyltransferase family 4 protein [Ferrovibrio sp.]|uniref:glycosyltransferase family 4 protein n=1 Tax=Ferrovibrio sp. TaxID=1917215 RepID=UPI003D0E7CF1
MKMPVIRGDERINHPSLMTFGVLRVGEMLEKGNVWYVRVYECFFKRVDVVYLLGRRQLPLTQGCTTLNTVGTGISLLDLLLAPVTLYFEARRLSPDVCITPDQVFSWWTASLVRLLLRKRVILMPVSIPEELYRDYGVSMSGLPIWMERLMLRLSYACAYRVLTAHAAGGYVSIFGAYPLSRNKLFVVKSFGEAMPAPGFVNALADLPPHDPTQLGDPMTLVYVGRMNREKLVEDLLRTLRRLIDLRPERHFRLQLIGDGPDRARLEALADELGVRGSVVFMGALNNALIPQQLVAADVFLSPLTGMSLREAACVGMPIIAYNRDWIVGMLRHEENALLVPSRDVSGMAEQILRMMDDPELRIRLSQGIRALADELWSESGLRESLAQLHVLVTQ